MNVSEIQLQVTVIFCESPKDKTRRLPLENRNKDLGFLFLFLFFLVRNWICIVHKPFFCPFSLRLSEVVILCSLELRN